MDSPPQSPRRVFALQSKKKLFKSPSKAHSKPIRRTIRSPISPVMAQDKQSKQNPTTFTEQENQMVAPTGSTPAIIVKPKDSLQDILRKVDQQSPERIPFYINTCTMFPIVADSVLITLQQQFHTPPREEEEKRQKESFPVPEIPKSSKIISKESAIELGSQPRRQPRFSRAERLMPHSPTYDDSPEKPEQYAPTLFKTIGNFEEDDILLEDPNETCDIPPVISPVIPAAEVHEEKEDTFEDIVVNADDWPDYPKILLEKKFFKSDMIHADLLQIYGALRKFVAEGKDLMVVYKHLYKVFLIHRKKPRVEERKTILNNLNYKTKSLYQVYPHLAFYGNSSMFTFRTVANVPEILLTRESETLKEEFIQAQRKCVPNRITQEERKRL